METREFWGRDMNEALQAVRASLGPDALILGTLTVPAGNGVPGGEKVKIMAMRDSAERGGEQGTRGNGGRGKTVAMREEQRGGSVEVPSMRGISSAGREGYGGEGLRDVQQQLADLKSLICWMLPNLKQSHILEELIVQGVPPDLLTRLMGEAEQIDSADEREKVRQALIRLIPTGGGVEEKMAQQESLALLGPPGAGKTSTMVKLTVRLAHRGERRVGWISLDTRRIAGAQELTVYAGILGIPCEVAEDREGLVRAMERLSGCDLVLIDTAGIGRNDIEGLEELASLLAEVPRLRRTLVLNATTNGPDMRAWVNRYRQVGFDSLLFTMVDECSHFGPLISTVLSCRQPVAYLTTGQRVAHDLEVAEPERLANLLLPQR